MEVSVTSDRSTQYRMKNISDKIFCSLRIFPSSCNGKSSFFLNLFIFVGKKKSSAENLTLRHTPAKAKGNAQLTTTNTQKDLVLSKLSDIKKVSLLFHFSVCSAGRSRKTSTGATYMQSSFW